MQYAINPYSENPIFTINQHIGFDEDIIDKDGKLLQKGDGQGIDGVLFSRELFEVDSYIPKPRLITFYHNSFGGDVKQGYDMFNAIINAKTKTKSVIAGFSYSTDGWVALAADEVYMYDFSTWMCHNPYDPTGSKKNTEVLNSVAKSIANVISSKSGKNGKPKKTPEEILEMMASTTRYNAQQMYDVGLINDKLDCNNEVLRNLKIENFQQDFKHYKTIFNKYIPNNDNNNFMAFEKIIGRINNIAINNKYVSRLADGSDEAAIESQIVNMENSYNILNKENVRVTEELKNLSDKVKILNESQEENQSRMKEMQTSKNQMETDISNKTKELDELKNKMDLMCSENEKMKNEDKERSEKLLKETVTNFVNQQVAFGRIKDDETIINSTIERGIKNFEDLKFHIENLPMNMHVPKLVNSGDGGKKKDDDENEPESKVIDRFRIENRERNQKEKEASRQKFFASLEN